VVKLTKLPAVRKKKGQRWTSEQARRFLTSAREARDPYYAAYVLILIQGLRKGRGSRASNGRRRLRRIDASYRVPAATSRTTAPAPRDQTAAPDADLPLPAIVAAALRQRLAERAEDETAGGDTWQDSNLMFTTKYGTPIEPRNFDRSSHSRITKAGVPRITVLDGRRTCGSLLVDLDVHPRVAMAILRHAQFAITMRSIPRCRMWQRAPA
jgi:hypothetical protein